MARARLLKPGFFTNEILAELPFAGRLLFAGLWILADKEGRLEDRPKRIKAALFPWDDVAIDDLLTGLAEREFLLRYEAEGVAVIQIAKFSEHQHPHIRENASLLPGPEKAGTSPEKPGRAGTRLPVTDPVSDPVPVSKDLSRAENQEPVFLKFPVVGKGPKEWPLSKAQVAEWAGLFPSLDVRAEARKALAWVQADPGRRKTFGGMARFLVGWLTRTTNTGGARPSVPSVESSEGQAYRAWREAGGCPHTPRCGNYTTCQVVAQRKRSA